MSEPRMPIAIVGLAGTFAQAKDLDEYWSNVLHEIDCITDVPATHWSIDDYYDADPKAADKTYSKRGGFIPDAEFNPLEFGLPPNILECTDVSQLLALVVARDALADAGYGEVNPHAENTGVVLGVSALKQITPLVSRLQYPIWKRVLRNRGVAEADSDAIIDTIKAAYIEWREDAFPGYLANVVAGRICNRLDLGGINCSVDAACASSMAALQFAAHELRSGNCDVMIAGGVDTNNSIMGYLSFSKTPAFTAHSHMRPFDADSDGMLIGEGIGMLVLRRLADAERDGDRIYAVVNGIGASSDGKYKSIYAPRQEGQELALRRAFREAGCRPASIGLIEAHGTGTPTGDPAELAALARVFSEDGPPLARVAIGSVKSQIGHTKVAAGAASLIKAAMALHDKVLPPTINVSTPHPALARDDSPFYVNTRARPWFSQGPRRAGVSSFGFGGTNFHVILEEHSPRKPETSRAHATPFALFLHAPDGTALQHACEQMAAALRSEAGEREWRAFVQASKRDTIPPEAARVGFVAATREDAATGLERVIDALRQNPEVETLKQPGGMHYRRRAMAAHGGVVALFPGQGSQYLEMGRELCVNFPVIHETFAAIDAVLVEHHQRPISTVLFPPPSFEAQVRDEQSRTLRATNHAQAALGAFNLGLYKLLRRSGFTPDFVAGHSLGELTALCAGGAIAEPDYLRLLVARGQAMAATPESGIDAGTLMAVSGDVEMLAQFVAGHADVTVANRNSKSQLVVAGSRSALDDLKSELAALGNTATFLPVAGAFHSRRVAHAQAPFAKVLDEVAFSPTQIPTYSNGTGTLYPEGSEAMRARLAEHLVSPVDFRTEIETIHRHGGRVFVECGPGAVLTGLVGNILAGEPHLAIALNPGKAGNDDRLLRESYVELRVAGVTIGDLDPYQSLPEVTVRKRGPIVRLNGAPYVSETTRAAFESALQQTAGPMVSDHQSKRVLEQTVTLTGDTSSLAHQRYLDNMANYSTRYFELMERLYGLITTANCPPDSLAVFERGMGQFHEQQLTAQQVHAQYLKNQVEYSQRVLQTQAEPLLSLRPALAPSPPPLQLNVAPQPARTTIAVPALPAQPPQERRVEILMPASPVAVAPAPPARPVPTAVAPADSDEIAAILIAVISEKTGYPVDTLDPSMDLDSDLGIDSLKRVEVMAALEGRLFNSLAGINFEAFAALRTISQIAGYLAGAAHATAGR